MKMIYFFLLFSTLFSLVFAFEPNFVEMPTISPDGRNITFIYRNDLWEVPFTGGVARRLTATNGDIGRPMYSADGLWLYFVSNREGRYKLYRIPTIGGQAELLSHENFLIRDVYADGQSILGMVMYPGEPRIIVRYDVGTKRLTEVSGFAGNNYTAISSDGNKVVFDRFGDEHRPAYQGSIIGQLWLYDIEKDEYTLISSDDFTHSWPRFSRVHPNRLYFVKSDGNQFQLFYMDDFDYDTKTQLTFFEDWSVRNISVSRNTDRIVFELFNEIWTFDPDTGLLAKVNIRILEDNLPYTVVHNVFDSELTNFAVSQNGELLVFSHKYDLFAVPTSGGEVRQLTFDQKGINYVLVMDDNETIYFTSPVQGVPKLFMTNIRNHVPTLQREPVLVAWSEDKYIQHITLNNNGDIFVVYNRGDERTKYAQLSQNGQIEEILTEERLIVPPFKTKDNTKMIYGAVIGSGWNESIRIKDMRTGRVDEIFIAQDGARPMLLSDDETYLFYNSWGKINMVNMVNDREVQEDNWEKIVSGSGTQDTAPSREWDINFDNFRTRNRNVVSESGWLTPLYATSDSTLVYVNWSNASLNSINFDGSDKTELLKYGSDHSFADYYLSKDRSIFYYIRDDKLHKYVMASKQSSAITFEYEYEYDIMRLNQAVFEEAWGDFGYYFYDPNMHGQDWDALFQKFTPYTKDLVEVSHLGRVIDEMIGRVNASHTGYSPRSENDFFTRDIAFAGFVPDFRNVLQEGLGIRKIYFDSELYQQYGIRDNDVILAINGQQINANTEITPFFVDKENKDISLRIRTPRGIVNAIIKGISWGDQWELRYNDMVLNNTRLVREKTDGKIGYLHIRQMDWESLEKFREDFLAVNFHTDAMIIDVRSNPGGRISDELLNIISRQPHSYEKGRGYPEIEPNPISYQKPIVVLIDEGSGSDAEVFSILFGDLNLGTLIGMPTGGAVIATRPWGLMDGSEMRMPIVGLYRLNMVNMENTGATPDIIVPRLPHHYINREDPQLERAIEELLGM